MLVNVTIPVYNEEKILPASIAALHEFLTNHVRFGWEVVIVDNASIDRTYETAQALCRRYDRVRVLHLDAKGKGLAVKSAWTNSSAEILSFMDVDLSTELSAFPSLIEPLVDKGFDIAAGSRLLRTSSTQRSLKRRIISRAYNVLVKAFFATTFSDAPCGFKAITKRAAEKLLPMVEDNGWFFDTELLILAEKLGYRVFDLPVTWIEDTDSRVNVVQTALHDFRGLVRVHRNLSRGKYQR